MSKQNHGDVHIPVEASPGKVPVTSAASPSAASKNAGILLRLAAIIISVVALVVMAKDKQVIVKELGDVRISLDAKYTYVKAFVFLVYANGIVALYCFLVVFAVLLNFFTWACSGKSVAWIVFVLDQGLTYILLGAAAASTEVAYLAKNGDEKVTWSKVCDSFSHFCNLVGASLVATFLSVVVMAILSVMSARDVFRNHDGSPR